MSTRKIAIKLLIKFDRELTKLQAKEKKNGCDYRHMEQLKAIKEALLKQ